MKRCRLLLFDLDGTLLRSDKTISQETLRALRECRERGMLIGVSTSRGESNALPFIGELQPDVLITSGGALVKYRGECICRAEFSGEETRRMIAAAREVCGADCEITVDTADAHYWNYKIDPKKQDRSWGDSIYTDFQNFDKSSLKLCVEIFEDSQARQLKSLLNGCDCIRFSDGCWYKFTKKTATKEWAISEVCSVCGISAEEIIAFGDDFADVGMLRFCGMGIAMGNAVREVKEQADLVIGSNDQDGIAAYLTAAFLSKQPTGDEGARFEEECARLFRQLGEAGKMVLSTSFRDQVTSRMMSVIIMGGEFYFQTDQNFRKYAQLKGNSRAALCIDNFQIEGICEEIGAPAENAEFCRLYEKNFPGSFRRYSLLPDERLFSLRPTFVKRWIYEEEVPYEEIYDFSEGRYRKERYSPRTKEEINSRVST